MLAYRHLTMKEQGEVNIIRLHGGIGETVQMELEGAIFEVLKNKRNKIIVDLAATRSLNSTLIGTLIMGMHKMKQSGGGLHLANLNDSVTDLFRVTNLKRVFPIFEGVEQAFMAFAA